jgi:amino acid transporter
MFGLLSGDVLASPRLLFAASRDKLLPDFLGKVHPKFATPYWSIIVFSAAGVILASSGGFNQLANSASLAMLIIYLSVVAAMIRLRFKDKGSEKGGFKVPFGLVIPILAIVIIGWLLSHVKQQEIISIAIFFAVLTVIYFINAAVRKRNVVA